MVRTKYVLILVGLCALSPWGCQLQNIMDLLGENGLGDGPGVTIRSPERGTWTESYTGSVQGTVADSWPSIDSLAINGKQVTLQSNRTFSTTVDYQFGINRIETIATSAEGHISTDRRCVMAGSFLPKDLCAEEVIEIRINQGTLDAVSSAAKKYLDGIELKDHIPSTLFSQTLGAYELHVYLVDADYTNLTLEFGTTRDGSIAATTLVEGLNIPIRAEGVVSAHPYSVETGVSVERISLSVLVNPTLKDGVVTTTVTDVSLTTQGFQLDLPDWIYDAAEYLGIDINNLLHRLLEDTVEELIRKTVRQTLDHSLNDLAIDYQFDLQGNSYSFSAKPHDLKIDPKGATLSLETVLQPAEWKMAHQGKGSLMFDYSRPDYATSSDIVLAFSADFFNQALYAFWGGGLLDLELGAEDMSLPELNLPFIPPQLLDFHITINSMLPPAVIPGTGNHLLDLQAGDIEIKLYAGDPGDNNLLLVLAAGFDAGFSLTDSNQGSLKPMIKDVNSWFDYVYPSIPYAWENSLENFVKMILQQQLIPLLVNSIGSIPIPDIAGVNLSNLRIEKGGKEAGFVTAGATVTFSR